MAEHISVPYRVCATLPEDKKKVIVAIEKIANGISEEKLKSYRKEVEQYF